MSRAWPRNHRKEEKKELESDLRKQQKKKRALLSRRRKTSFCLYDFISRSRKTLNGKSEKKKKFQSNRRIVNASSCFVHSRSIRFAKYPTLLLHTKSTCASPHFHFCDVVESK